MDDKTFDDRYVPRAEIDWGRSLWWWYPITRALHPAMRITALLLSAVAMWLLLRGVLFAQWLFEPRYSSEFQPRYFRSLADLQIAPWEVGQSIVFQQIGFRELAFLTFCLLWLTLVFGFFGGILTRRAAIELGQRTIAPWGETVRLVAGRLISYLWVTGMHMVAVTGLLILPWLLGLLSRLGPVAYVAGILLLLAYPLVFALGRLAISMFACFPLAVAAISCERNADAFEGFSRSNNYFFQRPVVAAMCVGALFFVGTIGYYLVFWWLLSGWHWMRDAYLSGAGLPPGGLILDVGTGNQPEIVTLQAARITMWISYGIQLTWWLIASYWFSYFWSGAASLYLILRRSVDNTELDDISPAIDSTNVSLPQLPPAPPATT